MPEIVRRQQSSLTAIVASCRIWEMRTLLGNAILFGDPLTFDATLLGEKDRAVIIRTYAPDPELDPAVFPNHGKASKSPKYNKSKGLDIGGEYRMMKVIPAAIAVNHGPALRQRWYHSWHLHRFEIRVRSLSR